MEQGFNYQLFEGIVTKIARDNMNYFKAAFGQEDVEQELWEKLFKLYSKDEVFRKLDSVQQTKVAWSVLGNKMIDMIRSRGRSLDWKYDDTASEQLHGYMNSNAGQVSPGTLRSMDPGLRKVLDGMSICFENAERDLIYNDLRNSILKWMENQPDGVRLVIKEKVFPSTETQQKWDDLCEKYPRYKGYTSIPGITLCKLLDIDKRYWFKAIKALREHLAAQGYCTT